MGNPVALREDYRAQDLRLARYTARPSIPYKQGPVQERLIEGMRKTGVPE